MRCSTFSLFFAILTVLFITIAGTCALASTENISDWEGVKHALKKQNISQLDINWQEVDGYCRRTEGTAKSAFNRCRYRMAVSSHQYQMDKSACTAEAEAQKLDTSKQVRQVEQVTGINLFGKRQIVTITRDNTKEEAARQHAIYAKNCMYKRHWNNPDNWLEGQTLPKPAYNE